MKSLHNLTVLILGLGDSGLAMASWCARSGAKVRVWDSRDDPPQAAALKEAVPGAALYTGALDAAALQSTFSGVDRVFKSPGLAPGDERLSALFRLASHQEVPVHGELDLFVQALVELKRDHGYVPKVVAITGTNGKTTTTAMTHLLISRTGLRSVVAGNIGPTMLQTLSDALDLEALPAVGAQATEVDSDCEGLGPEAAASVSGEGVALFAKAGPVADPEVVSEAATEVPSEQAISALPSDDAPLIELVPPPPAAPEFNHLPQVWVLELSSFQLHDVHGFEPSAAAVLNITEDHLDWHGNMTAYAADKARIFGSTAVMVINRDDPLVSAMGEPVVAEPLTVITARGKTKIIKPPKVKPRHVVRFGLNSPQRPGDFGLVTDNGMAWLVRAREADETIKPKRGSSIEEDIVIQRLMPADALRVRGRHNAANALASLALATAIGCPLAPMLHGLREYSGEPHRVAYVATLNGVDLFDDSKGTNVGATVAAVLGLGADRAPAKLVLILGGEGKGQNFEPLLEPIRTHARAVATLGRDAQQIEAVLETLELPMQRFDSVQEAVRWSAAQAQYGDIVLLSPACASLDMFDNYKHRAKVFVDEVHAMVQELGEVVV